MNEIYFKRNCMQKTFPRIIVSYGRNNCIVFLSSYSVHVPLGHFVMRLTRTTHWPDLLQSLLRRPHGGSARRKGQFETVSPRQSRCRGEMNIRGESERVPSRRGVAGVYVAPENWRTGHLRPVRGSYRWEPTYGIAKPPARCKWNCNNP